MTKRPLGTMLAISLALSMIPAAGQVTLPAQRAAVGDQEAYLPMPPELIAAPVVERVAWSADQRYLLLERREMRLTPSVLQSIARGMQQPAGGKPSPPPSALCLVLWDSQTHLSREVWRADGGVSRIEAMAWLPGAYTAIVQVVDSTPGQLERQWLMRIGPGMARAQLIDIGGQGEDGFIVFFSPAAPIAIIQRTHTEVTGQAVSANGQSLPAGATVREAYLLDRDGALGPTIQLPGIFLSVNWTPDGSPIAQFFVKLAGSEKLTVRSFSIDLRTGQITPMPPPPISSSLPWKIPLPPPQTLSVRVSRSSPRESDSAPPVETLWLEGRARSGLTRVPLASDSGDARLLSDWQAVVYESGRAWWVIPILRLPRERYEAQVRDAERATVFSNAKQLGLALLMYSQDYDETLPSGEGINDKLRPYLRNDPLFDGFNYTFPGGKLSDIEKPAETELGYVNGPGGQAVIYGDGHVAWR